MRCVDSIQGIPKYTVQLEVIHPKEKNKIYLYKLSFSRKSIFDEGENPHTCLNNKLTSPVQM